MLEYNGNELSTNPKKLIYWIEERYRILMLKQEGDPPPWSEDPIFQQTYFCNVMREDDKVTKWIRTFWNNPKDKGYTQAMCIARLINKPSTLEALGYPHVFDPKRFKEVMNSLEHPWGGAYIVSTCGRKQPKVDYMCELILSWWGNDLTVLHGSTLGAMFNRLTALNGLGSFMAGQVIADLKNTIGHPLFKAEDWWTWSTHGPGSLRGMGWFFGHKVTPSRYDQGMVTIRKYVDERLDTYIPHFSNQDLQNCLCEYDKYMRILNGTGRSKRKYKGG